MIYTLDTNTVSLLLRGEPNVSAQFEVETRIENRFLGCPMVYYEVRRGLISKDAKAKMAIFRALFAGFEWQDFTRADFDIAAQLWAQRKTAGRPIADADLLIAVFALNRDAVLVTDNEKDFDGLSVNVENWKQF